MNCASTEQRASVCFSACHTSASAGRSASFWVISLTGCSSCDGRSDVPACTTMRLAGARLPPPGPGPPPHFAGEGNGVLDFAVWFLYAQHDNWPFPARRRGMRGRRRAGGVIFPAQPFARLRSADGFLLQVACSAQCPACYAPRPRGEAGSDTQGGQKGKPGLAPYRQRGVFHPTFGGYSHPIRPQAQGSRFPAWELPGTPSERRSRGQVQESVVACISRSSCGLRRNDPCRPSADRVRSDPLRGRG
jgi:hypothetical protein